MASGSLPLLPTSGTVWLQAVSLFSQLSPSSPTSRELGPRLRLSAGNNSALHGDVAQLVERRTGMPLGRVRFPGAAREFSPRVNFQCRLSYSVCTLLCAIACINICAHIKDPVVHVRVWWIMETLKHPACTVGCVAQLRRSWLSSDGKQPEFPTGEIPLGQYSCKKYFFKKKRKGMLMCDQGK